MSGRTHIIWLVGVTLGVLLTGTALQAAWSLGDDFNSYSLGNITGQGDWTTTVNAGNARVVARPGGGAGDQSLYIVDATRTRSNNAIPDIADGSQATVFFQTNVDQVSGYNNFRLTLANEAAPSSYTHSDVFFRIYQRTNEADHSLWRNRLWVGPGDGSQEVTSYRFDNDIWYNVWMDVDNAAKTYEVYVSPAGAISRTQLAVGGNTTFAFDNTPADSLKTFWLWSDGTHDGRAIWLDNLQVDTAGFNAANPLDVDLINSSAFGTSWEVGANWSDGQPAGPGKYYHVGRSPTNRGLRTPNNVNNPTFPGDVLTIHSTGAMGLKHQGTLTVDNLVLNGGRINASSGNRTFNIAGDLTVAADSTISVSGTGRRDIRLSSALHGSGNLAVTGNASYSIFRLNADVSDYTGAIIPDNSLDRLHIEDTGGDPVTVGGAGGLNWTSLEELDVAVNGGNAVAVTPAGQPVVVGNGSGLLSVARRWSSSPGGDTVGTFDLRDASSATIDVDQVRLGVNTTNTGNTTGVLLLPASGPSQVSADTITIGDSNPTGNPTESRLGLGGGSNTVEADTITVGGRKSEGRIDILAGGTYAIGSAGRRTDLFVGRNNVGTSSSAAGTVDLSNGSGSMTLNDVQVGYGTTGGSSGGATGSWTSGGGSIDIGPRGGDTAEFTIGYNNGGGNGSTGGVVGTVDLSAAGSLVADVGNLYIGTALNSSTARGSLTLAAGNDISANTIRLGYSTNVYHTSAALESQMYLGNSNDLHVDTMVIGNDRARGLVAFAAPGGSLSIDGNNNTRADLYVARNPPGTGSQAIGVLDMSDAASFNGLFDDFFIGDKSNTSGGRAKGTVWLAATNNIDADAIIVARGGNTGATSTGDQSQLYLGASNTIVANSLLIGGRKANGLVTFVSPGGDLDLGTAGQRVELQIGYNNVNTGTTAVGVFDTSAGTADVFASNIVLGHKSGGGSGSANGSYIVGDGSTNVSGNIHETGDGGTSRVRVLGTHDFVVGGDIAVDRFTVGYDGTGGTVTMGTGDAAIGTAVHPTDLLVGRRQGETSNNFVGTLDVRDTSSFTARLDEFRIGTSDGGDNQQGKPRGAVYLGPDNDIDARLIVVGESPGVGLAGFTNLLQLNGQTTIAADTLTVAGSKATSRLEFGPGGGTVNLGSDVDRMDMLVGNQTVWTSGGATGEADFSGGTVNAFLDRLVLGQKDAGAGGTTRGTFTMSAGTVDANSIVLGSRLDTSGGTPVGTLNLQGGTLKATSIDDGGGTANFNMTGGTLHVGTFGFDLLQQGGLLAPGNSPGTTVVTGNYDLLSGAYEVEINGYTPGIDPGFDFVDVSGVALLDSGVLVDLLGDWMPAEYSTFNVLTAEDVTLGPGFYLDESRLARQMFDYRVIPGGNGEYLQLRFAIPEPAAAPLALLGFLGLALWRRRRA